MEPLSIYKVLDTLIANLMLAALTMGVYTYHVKKRIKRKKNPTRKK